MSRSDWTRTRPGRRAPEPLSPDAHLGCWADLAERATTDDPYTDHLAGGVDPEDEERLERLLARIPPGWAEAIRLWRLDGLRQAEAAKRLGITQPSLCLRCQTAMRVLRLTARHLPDLVREEVADVLRAAGEDERVVGMVSAYWVTWRTSGIGWPQGTVWGVLFDARWGFVARRSGEDSEVGEVARGVARIRTWRAHGRDAELTTVPGQERRRRAEADAARKKSR